MKKYHYIAIIAVVFAAIFSYIFDARLDMNGDNCSYYSYATSLAQGSGYCDVSQSGAKPSNTFPFGYPLLMTPLRLVTDSIIAQKVLNGIFFLGAIILLFLLCDSIFKDRKLALVLSIGAMVNARVWGFITIMMSESSFILFSVGAMYLLHLIKEREGEREWWREPLFYALIAVSAYAFHIRTQGVTLLVAVAVYFLFNRKWFSALAYGAGCYLLTLPWAIRGAVMGVGGSRYASQIFAVNQWRPEEGSYTLWQVIVRGWDTLQMLISKAITASVMPRFPVDYSAPSTFWMWAVGLTLIALIVYGALQFKHLAPFIISYSIFTVGIICLWSAPSEDRYIATILPLWDMLVVLALVSLLQMRFGKFPPYLMLIPIFLVNFSSLELRHNYAKRDYSPGFKSFVETAKEMKAIVKEDVVVCSRKANIFYMFSGKSGVNYRYTSDAKALIRGMVRNNVDYVVLDNMNFASTNLYLRPAMNEHRELFIQVPTRSNAQGCFLLKFDREAAKKMLGDE